MVASRHETFPDGRADGAGYVARRFQSRRHAAMRSRRFARASGRTAQFGSDWQNFIISIIPINVTAFDAGPVAAERTKTRFATTPGRIYRVVWEKARKLAIALLKGASTAGLVNALGSDNPSRRLTAQRLLVEASEPTRWIL